MLEGIRKKWKEASDKGELQDIQYCRKNPNGWKTGMYGISMVYFIGMILILIFIVPQNLIGLLLILIMLLSQIYIWRLMKNIQKKAFPKN